MIVVVFVSVLASSVVVVSEVVGIKMGLNRLSVMVEVRKSCELLAEYGRKASVEERIFIYASVYDTVGTVVNVFVKSIQCQSKAFTARIKREQ